MATDISPGFNLSDSFNAGFNLSSAFDPDKFKPKVDSDDLWGRVGDYSGLSSQPSGELRTPEKKEDDTRKQAKMLARAFKQKQFQEQGEQGLDYRFIPQQQQTSSSGSAYQVDPYTTVYNPAQQQPFTVQGSKSSGPFGSIGQAVGLGGTALGVFGPFGPAVGLAAGQAVDSLA